MMAAVDRRHGGQQRLRIVDRHESDARQQRLERGAVVLVRGHRQRAEGPSVERVLERDEFRARFAAGVPVATGKLEAGFDRLGAAVAEKGARQPRQLRQPLRELPLQRVVEQVRRVDQRLRLIGDRARQSRMRVAERGDADSRQQIEILAPVRVVQPHALAAHERDRQTLVRLQDVSRLAHLNLVDGRCLHKLLRQDSSPALRPDVLVAQVFRPAIRVALAGTAPAAAASSADSSRPSMIRTSPTPAAIACSQARSFAIMPAVAVPPLTSRSMAAASSDRRRRAVRAQHAGRRAGDRQPPRAEPRGQMPRQRVGIHVQQPAVAADSDARHHRHEPVADERRQQRRVRRRARNADAAQIHRSPVDRSMERRRLRKSAARRRRRSIRPPGRPPRPAPRRIVC